MTRKIFSLLFLVAIVIMVLSCIQHKESDEAAKEFVIRTGVNVSHWLSQSKKRGEERERYITKADFDTIASIGFDHVRIPIDEVQMWDTLGNKEKEAFILLHNAINWAIDAKLRVIVDLHIIRSHYFNAKANTLWTDPVEQEKLVEMWRQLSEELKQYPKGMLAYEIMNEAVADDPDDWNKLFAMVLADIRINEPERKVVIGSNRWQIPNTFPDLKLPENDTNIILSFHFYTPEALTHHLASWTGTAEYTGPVNYPGWIVDTSFYSVLSENTVEQMRKHANGNFNKEVLRKKMMPAIKVAKEYNLPLYCGEYGVYPTIPEEISLAWYKDVCEIFNEYNIAFCHWAYKGDFPIVGEGITPNRKLVSVLTAE